MWPVSTSQPWASNAPWNAMMLTLMNGIILIDVHVLCSRVEFLTRHAPPSSTSFYNPLQTLFTTTARFWKCIPLSTLQIYVKQVWESAWSSSYVQSISTYCTFCTLINPYRYPWIDRRRWFFLLVGLLISSYAMHEGIHVRRGQEGKEKFLWRREAAGSYIFNDPNSICKIIHSCMCLQYACMIGIWVELPRRNTH